LKAIFLSVLLPLALYAGGLTKTAGVDTDFPREAGSGAITLSATSPDGRSRLLGASLWIEEKGEDGVPYNYLASSVIVTGTAKVLSPTAILATEKPLLVGESVVQAMWSEDSRYCLFSVTSTNGHSPWHFPVCLFEATTKMLYSVERVTKLTVGPEIDMDENGRITVMEAGPDTSDGVDFEHPVRRTVTIAEVTSPKGEKQTSSSSSKR
jgi:hypothetical protein